LGFAGINFEVGVAKYWELWVRTGGENRLCEDIISRYRTYEN
jgi:hypothetical protein